MKNLPIRLLFACMLTASLMTQAWAKAGLSTRFGDVYVENLDIGKSYNTRELANLPLKVTNTGDDTIDLLIDIVMPNKKDMKEHVIDQGYEPIPDLSWLRVSKDKFLLPPGESAYADVIITIPDDPKLYGKKFQVDIWSHGAPRTFLNLGIYSHLMFTVIASPEDRAEETELRKKGLAANLNFDLLPDKVYFQDIEVGQKTTIKKLGKTIKLVNTNEFPLKFFVKAVKIQDTPLTLQQGFEAPESLSWMNILTPELEVGANSIRDIDVEINIPDDQKHRGKGFMFVFNVEPDTDKVVLVSYYGKIYITTKDSEK